MLNYIIKRILALIPVLLVVAVVVFLLMYLTPGDPVSVLLGDEASEETIEQVRHELGYDLPVYEQFFNWFKGLLVGDLGYSIFYKESVLTIFLKHLGPTIWLAIYSQMIAILIAVSFGVYAAKKRGTWIDNTLSTVSVLGISIPSFLMGLFLVLLFAVQLKLLPVAGYKPIDEGYITHIRYLILPAIALGTMQAGLIMRMTRSSVLDVMKAPYIKTAKSKGLNENSITYKHALKNAFLPILTVIGESFGSLITGAAVVETVFNIPGLGSLIVNSIERRDFVTIQGTILMMTVMYVFLNLIVDLLYGVIDPRVRISQGK